LARAEGGTYVSDDDDVDDAELDDLLDREPGEDPGW
jgi:hypothetical protein